MPWFSVAFLGSIINYKFQVTLIRILVTAYVEEVV